jgi:hypothetical protein
MLKGKEKSREKPGRKRWGKDERSTSNVQHPTSNDVFCLLEKAE